MARILLVEDDIDLRPLLEHILQLEPDYEVTAVETVANATALLQKQPFDLVLADVDLPDGSGLRVADKATEMGVKVLVITGQGLLLKPGDLDSYDYLLKPIRVQSLLDAIRQRLQRRDIKIKPSRNHS